MDDRLKNSQYKKYSLNDDNFLNYHDYSMILESAGYYTESYIGKSDTILRAESVLSDMIRDMKVNPTADYTNDKRNDLLSKLLQKQFGFKRVYIIWNRTAEVLQGNLYTLISSAVFSDSSSMALVNDKKKGYYDTRLKHTCVFHLSSTLPSQAPISGSEYMALILHEVGHNFDYSPYMVIRYLTHVLKTLVINIATIPAGKDIDASVIADISVRTIVTNSKIATIFNGAFNKFFEKILSAFPAFKKMSLIIKKQVSFIARGFEMFTAPIDILAIPLFMLLSPVTNLLLTPTRKTEVFADSFAVAYGYAPELSSALIKVEKLNMLRYTPNGKFKEPSIFKFGKDLAMLNRYVIMAFVCPSHGTINDRITKMIDTLSDDVRVSDYPPEVEKLMREQIQESITIYKKYLAYGNDEIRLPITVYMKRLIIDIFGGDTEIISKLFPDNIA